MLRTSTARASTAERRARAFATLATWVLKHGHAALTVTGAAAALGMSHAWVSMRLGDRGAMLHGIAAHMSQRIVSDLAALPHDLEPSERVRRIVRAMLPRLPQRELAHAWELLDACRMLRTGPAFYAVVDALEPITGPRAASCAAAMAGVLDHVAHSGTPWTRADVAADLLTVVQGFLARARNGAKP